MVCYVWVFLMFFQRSSGGLIGFSCGFIGFLSFFCGFLWFYWVFKGLQAETRFCRNQKRLKKMHTQGKALEIVITGGAKPGSRSSKTQEKPSCCGLKGIFFCFC